jgi:molybdopterin-guanine dinucleotide biosynthesis protein
VDLILVEGSKSRPLPKIVVLPSPGAEIPPDYSQVIATVRRAPSASAEPAFEPTVEDIGALVLAHLGLGK